MSAIKLQTAGFSGARTCLASTNLESPELHHTRLLTFVKSSLSSFVERQLCLRHYNQRLAFSLTHEEAVGILREFVANFSVGDSFHLDLAVLFNKIDPLGCNIAIDGLTTSFIAKAIRDVPEKTPQQIHSELTQCSIIESDTGCLRLYTKE